MPKEVVIEGRSYVGRGSSRVYFTPSERPGVRWDDGKQTHSLADVVKTASNSLLSMLQLKSEHATVLVPEHFLSALYHRDVSGTFHVEGLIPTLSRKVMQLPKNAHSFPAANAGWFYERLPSGVALPKYDIIEDHTYHPSENTTINVFQDPNLSIALSWKEDPKGLNPLPFETNYPKFYMDAKGINWGSKIPKCIGNLFFPEVEKLYDPAKIIRATPTRNSHFGHTAGSDFPGEILAILGGTLRGRVEIAHNGKTKVSNHQGRLDAIRELYSRGIIQPAQTLFEQ